MSHDTDNNGQFGGANYDPRALRQQPTDAKLLADRIALLEGGHVMLENPFTRAELLEVYKLAAQRYVPQQWIPVSERLPDKDAGLVLAAWNRSGPGEGVGMETMTAISIRALKRAASDEDDDCFITHWMPLPAAPTCEVERPSDK